MQETLWKSFLKKRVRQMPLAKQESCKPKSICWNCSRQNLSNRSWKNPKSSIDCQHRPAKRGSQGINSRTLLSLSKELARFGRVPLTQERRSGMAPDQFVRSVPARAPPPAPKATSRQGHIPLDALVPPQR